MEPGAEAGRHVFQVDCAAAGADAVARGNEQGGVVGKGAGGHAVGAARRHLDAGERVARLEFKGDAKRVAHGGAVDDGFELGCACAVGLVGGVLDGHNASFVEAFAHTISHRRRPRTRSCWMRLR